MFGYCSPLLYQVDGHAFRCLGVTYLNPEFFQVTLSFVFHRELVLAGCKLYPGKIAVCIHGCGCVPFAQNTGISIRVIKPEAFVISSVIHHQTLVELFQRGGSEGEGHGVVTGIGEALRALLVKRSYLLYVASLNRFGGHRPKLRRRSPGYAGDGGHHSHGR